MMWRLVLGVLPYVWLAPLVHSTYTCEGYNDNATQWPSDQQLRNFSNTIQGKPFSFSLYSLRGLSRIFSTSEVSTSDVLLLSKVTDLGNSRPSPVTPPSQSEKRARKEAKRRRPMGTDGKSIPPVCFLLSALSSPCLPTERRRRPTCSRQRRRQREEEAERTNSFRIL